MSNKAAAPTSSKNRSGLGRIIGSPAGALIDEMARQLVQTDHVSVGRLVKHFGKKLLACWVVVVPTFAAAQETSHDSSTSAFEVKEVLDEQPSAAKQALLNDLDSDESNQRIAALKALAKLGPDAEFALPRLLKILTQPAESYERNLAIRCLARIGPAAAEAVPRLLEILKSKPSSNVSRFEAASALARMGRAGEVAIPTLIAILSDPDESEKRYLTKRSSPPAQGLILPLLRKDENGGYTDQRDMMLIYAISCLASFGPAASDALPAIRRVRDEPDALAVVKDLAIKAIQRIEEGDEPK